MRDYAQIPEELKKLNRWVCAWNDSKCPMSPYEMKAAHVSRPDTWSDFETALVPVNDHIYDYLGLVFYDDGYVGIDIDKGFEDGLLTELGADIIGTCRSYTEISKSGRGVHIILKGDLPFDGANNRNGVEIYKTGRYFITTGDKLIFSEIIENQNAINHVLSRYFENFSQKHVGKSENPAFYSPQFNKSTNGKISLTPHYPTIGEGGRNQSMASLAGTLHNFGYSREEMERELLRANKQACDPPLSVMEIKHICKSICKYERR